MRHASYRVRSVFTGLAFSFRWIVPCVTLIYMACFPSLKDAVGVSLASDIRMSATCEVLPSHGTAAALAQPSDCAGLEVRS